MILEHIAFDSRRRFGVEIEVNRALSQGDLQRTVNGATGDTRCDITGWGYTVDNTNWVVKPDSSCGDLGDKHQDGGGYEVVSPAGRGAGHLTMVEKVTAALKSAKAKVNNFCGLHCQVEIKDFDNKQAAILLAYWCKIERLLSHCVPLHRTTSKHCKLHVKSKKFKQTTTVTTIDSQLFWSTMRLTSLDASAKRNALTLVNYQRTRSQSSEWSWFQRPTVELRLPESSLDCYNTKNWTRMFVHFVETCAKRSFPKDLKEASIEQALSILGLAATEPDHFAVLSPGLFETKCWLLHRLATYSRKRSIALEAWRAFNKINSCNLQWRFQFPKVSRPEKPSNTGNSDGKRRRTVSNNAYGEIYAPHDNGGYYAPYVPLG